jgi:hypothetical protein
MTDDTAQVRKRDSYGAVLSLLTHDLEARGDQTDQPPGLCFLYESADGLWRISHLDMPDSIWVPDPGARLVSMASRSSLVARVAKELSLEPNQDWRGVAFFAETWYVSQDLTKDGTVDPVLEEISKARLLHEHPARVESRCWWVAFPDGTFLSTLMAMDGSFRMTTTDIPGEPGYQDRANDGRIPDSLLTMAKALA